MATKKEETKGLSPFAARLARDNAKVKAERAARVSSSLEAAQKMLIYGLEEQVRVIEDSLDEMVDISTDNTSTTLNVISKNFNSKEFTATMQTRKVNLKLKQQELAIAQDTYDTEFQIPA